MTFEEWAESEYYKDACANFPEVAETKIFKNLLKSTYAIGYNEVLFRDLDYDDDTPGNI